MAHLLYPSLQAPVLTQAQEPEQVTESRWHQPWSEPVRQKIAPALAIALIASSGNSFSPFPLPNVSPAADKYWARFDEPVRLKPGLSATLQQTLALVEAPPFEEAVLESKWHQPWSEPSVKAKIGLTTASQQALAYLEAPPFPETATESRWHYPWSEPVRVNPGLGAALQQTLAYQYFDQPQLDKFVYALSEPVRVKPGLNAALQAAFPAYAEAPPFTEGVTESRWHQPWSEPVRVKLGLRTGDQSVLAFTYFPPPPIDRYLFPWSEPVRVKQGVASADQQWQVSFVIEPLFPNPRLTIANTKKRIRLVGWRKTTII